MKQTSVARGAIMAALAMAASSGLPIYTSAAAPRQPRQPPCRNRMVGGSNAEIDAWNKAVDARKAAKAAAKIGEDV